MKDTGFDVPEEDFGRLAMIYTNTPQSEGLTPVESLTNQVKQKATFFSGGGGLVSTIDCLLGNYSYPGEANIIIVYQSHITGGIIRPCHESMSIDEFKPEDIPWDRLAFDTTRKALKKYIEKNESSI